MKLVTSFSMKFKAQEVALNIYFCGSVIANIRVGKFDVQGEYGIQSDIIATETKSVRSLIRCVTLFHSREDACFTAYQDAVCRVYTSGCCPSNMAPKTGSLLLRRDLTGLGNDNNDCSYHKNQGNPSGVYMIYPEGFPDGVSVYCDMDTDNGGWTLIQRRVDGSIDFYRNWEDYKIGFGNVSNEFWLGNEVIHRMTRTNSYHLRIDMTHKSDGQSRYAKYFIFKLSDESDRYRLTIGEYCGDADDNYGMSHNNNATFGAFDNDISVGYSNWPCSVESKSAWWFKKCTYVNLNAQYNSISFNWISTELSASSMKIRRK